MLDAGKTWHPKFGPVAAADVPRYDKGERQLNGRWVSATVDGGRHTDMKSGWQVRTDHFLVTTNHSLEAASGLAARLERLYQVWRQLFAGFFLSDKEVAAAPATRVRVRRFANSASTIIAIESSTTRRSVRGNRGSMIPLGIYFDATHAATLLRRRRGRRRLACRNVEPQVPRRNIYRRAALSIRSITRQCISCSKSRSPRRSGSARCQCVGDRRRCDLFRNAQRTFRSERGSVLHRRPVDRGAPAVGHQATEGGKVLRSSLPS